jgi:hypothetical protein
MLCTVVPYLLAASSHATVLHVFESPNSQEDGRFGWSVACVPDANGDASDDVVIGAYGEASTTAMDRTGSAYLYNGATGELLQVLSSPSEQQYGYFGFSVAGMGDVNGDGAGDLVIGAVFEDPDPELVNAGHVYLMSGANGSVIRTVLSPNQEVAGYFGYSVAGVSDADGDGVNDFAVGAPGEDPGDSPINAGRVYVFSGQNGGIIHILSMLNEEEEARFGTMVRPAGDIDLDGYDDVLVGVPDAGASDEGRALVFSGQTGDVIHDLVSPAGQIEGRFGSAVSKTEDLFGDGFTDVIVAAPGEGGTGNVYVFSGQTGEVIHALVSPDGVAGAAYFGRSVVGIGDVNDDVYPDIAVGCLVEESRQEWSGIVHVMSGQTGELISTVESPGGSPDKSGFGWSVAGAGDQNGDAVDDIIVGAYSESEEGTILEAGLAYLLTCDPNAVEGVSIGVPNALVIEGPWPNPTKGPFRLALILTDGEIEHIHLGLYDALGRCVETILTDSRTDDGRIELHWAPLNRFPSGSYWLRAIAGGVTTQKKIVLIH